MYGRILTIPILALILVIAACAPAGEPAAAIDDDAVAREVKAASEAANAALNAGDIDGYLANYMEDAVWLPPNAEEIVGAAVARSRMNGMFDQVSIDADWSIEEQIVMGPEWVAQRGQFNMIISPTGDEGEEIQEVGSFVNVWKKDSDGKWKITLDIWNSDRGVTAAAKAVGK